MSFCEWNVLIRGPSPPLALGSAAVLALSGLARNSMAMRTRRTRPFSTLHLQLALPTAILVPAWLLQPRRASPAPPHTDHAGGFGSCPTAGAGTRTQLHYIVETEPTLLGWGMGSHMR